MCACVSAYVYLYISFILNSFLSPENEVQDDKVKKEHNKFSIRNATSDSETRNFSLGTNDSAHAGPSHCHIVLNPMPPSQSVSSCHTQVPSISQSSISFPTNLYEPIRVASTTTGNCRGRLQFTGMHN